ALENARAALAGALGERECDVGRIGLPVRRQEYAAHDPVEIQQWILLTAFGGAQHVRFEAERLGHGGAAGELLVAILRERYTQGTVLPIAGGDAGFGFEAEIELGRVLGELRQIQRRPELADEARRVPCRTRRQPFAL